MNRISSLFCLFIFFLTLSKSYSQSISGTIEDPDSGEKLFGATILEKGTANGVVTDFDGKFKLDLQGELPVTLVVSYVGYESQEVQVSSVNQKINIKLKTDKVQLESLTVTDSRITEKQKESPVTVESMDAMAVKETPAVNFYEGLGNLKGVDLTSASMGFKVVNTRGFNSTRPVRSLQIIDGVDNQAPGLNFSVGNFAGSSELDIQRVELIVGANSALYGPNAFNGVISMTTKDPFIHQGLDVMGKVGERNLRETAIRFARGHKLFGSEKEVVAYKLNFSYMQALDWEADNFDPTDQSLVGKNNPGVSSEVHLILNLGGAIGDTLWQEAGELPIISFHGEADSLTPINTKTVIVAATGQPVVEVSGSRHLSRRADNLGNQNFYDQFFSDPYTQSAQSKTSYPGFMPFYGAANGYEPWAWYNENSPCIAPGSGFGSAANPLATKAKALAYIDTIMGYFCPRAVQVLGLPGNTVGINNPEELEKHILVYPNPSRDVINISSDFEVFSAALYSINGGLVWSNVNERNSKFSINVSSLKKGFYFIRLETDRGIVNKKVVVN